MPNYSSHIFELARRGAEHRYQELKAELALLMREFPHLRGGSANRLGSPTEAVKSPIRRRRRKMSMAARKAIGDRMTKLWAARRKAKKG
jgi:hypothetical protein